MIRFVRLAVFAVCLLPRSPAQRRPRAEIPRQPRQDRTAFRLLLQPRRSWRHPPQSDVASRTHTRPPVAHAGTAAGAGGRRLCRLPVSGYRQGQRAPLSPATSQWRPRHFYTDRVCQVEAQHCRLTDAIEIIRIDWWNYFGTVCNTVRHRHLCTCDFNATRTGMSDSACAVNFLFCRYNFLLMYYNTYIRLRTTDDITFL